MGKKVKSTHKSKTLTAKDLVQSLQDSGSEMDIELFAQTMVEKLGGLDAFCEMLADVVKDKETPSTLRGTIYRMIADAMRYATEARRSKDRTLGDLSDKELESMLSSIQDKTIPVTNGKG